MSSDRRRYPRHFVRVELDFSSGHNFFRGTTRDISVGGVFLETTANIPVGEIVNMDLRFFKRNLRVNAVVKWVHRERGRVVGVGLEFLALSDTARRAIEAFMVLRPPLPLER